MRTQYSISRSISGAQDHWPFRGSGPLAVGGNRPVRGRLAETRPHPPYYLISPCPAHRVQTDYLCLLCGVWLFPLHISISPELTSRHTEVQTTSNGGSYLHGACCGALLSLTPPIPPPPPPHRLLTIWFEYGHYPEYMTQ